MVATDDLVVLAYALTEALTHLECMGQVLDPEWRDHERRMFRKSIEALAPRIATFGEEHMTVHMRGRWRHVRHAYQEMTGVAVEAQT